VGQAVAVRAAGKGALWLLAGAVAGAVCLIAAYRLGVLIALLLPVGIGFAYWAYVDPRVGVVGLLLMMGTGEKYGVDLGLFTLSPFKLALALVLMLAVVRELSAGGRPALSIAAVRPTFLEVSAILLVVAWVLSSFAATDQVAVVKETVISVLTVLLFMVTRRVLHRTEDVRFVFWGVAGLGAIIGVQAVAAYVRGQRLNDVAATASDLRVGSVLGHPNQLAGLLVLILPIAVALLFSERRSWYRLAAAAASGIIGLALLTTLSRTGWIAGFVGLGVVVFLARGRVLVWALALVVVVALLVSFAGVTGALGERAASATDLGQYEVASRLDFWSASLKILETSPVVGVGLANFAEAYSDVNLQGKWNLPGSGYRPPPHAHNLVLTLLAETGVVGVAAFFAFVAAVISALVRALRGADPRSKLLVAGIAGALAAIFVDNSADVTLFNNVTQATFWVILGCMAALNDVFDARSVAGADSPPGTR
jgi:O-antigen ligase